MLVLSITCAALPRKQHFFERKNEIKRNKTYSFGKAILLSQKCEKYCIAKATQYFPHFGADKATY
jgi:hypothetical protein